jgi:lipopolysaccharide/colanic/teichoic acid biosynthesis glycosyltransferase
VLKGDMSVVGPRPERPEFAAQLEKQVPFYRLRHAVRPGMAGWALINYGYGRSVEDTLIKVQYDLYYIKHQSLYLDILILLKTLERVVLLQGSQGRGMKVEENEQNGGKRVCKPD